MAWGEALSVIVGALATAAYLFCGVYTYFNRTLYQIAQRSYLLTLSYIFYNLVLIATLILQFIIKPQPDSLAARFLEGLYGFFKFLILITYFLRCLRLSIVFSTGRGPVMSCIRALFRGERLLLAMGVGISLAISGLGLLGLDFLFVNNLLQKKCICMDSFLLLAFITFSIFSLCIWVSQRVDYKYSFTMEIIAVLTLYVLVLNIELFVPYPLDPHSQSQLRVWLWYWSVLILNFLVFSVTVCLPIYLSYRFRDQNFIMPTIRCVAQLTLFLGEIHFKQPFVAFLQHVQKHGLPQLQAQPQQRPYYRHCAYYLKVIDQLKAMQRNARIMRGGSSLDISIKSKVSVFELDRAQQIFEGLIRPQQNWFGPGVYRVLEGDWRQGGIKKESMGRLLHWLTERLNVLFNEYKSTMSYRKLVEVVTVYEQVNKNMLDFGMIQ